MKILHVAASLDPKWGGPAKVVIELTQALVKKGVEVAIFAPSESDKGGCISNLKGVNVNLFPKNFLSRFWTSYSSPLAKSLMKEVSDFDLIHIHEIWHYPNFAAYRAAKRAGKAYIVTIHGALEPWCLNYKALTKRIYTALIQRRILCKASALHALTREEVKQIQNFGVGSPVAVIPNGIDPEEFRELPLREELENSYPELNGKKVVLFLGRIHPKKGLDILTKAFAKIAKGRENISLLIAGPDNEGYQAHVEKLLESKGIINRATFTGMLTGRKKLAALSRADAFVLPSYSEGFTMTILEAMACRLPLVITRQCYFPEVAEIGAGFVVEPDPNQLAKALLKLLDNSKMGEKMGANGRRLVMESFTWDKIADQMTQLYQSVLRQEAKQV